VQFKLRSLIYTYNVTKNSIFCPNWQSIDNIIKIINKSKNKKDNLDKFDNIIENKYDIIKF